MGPEWTHIVSAVAASIAALAAVLTLLAVIVAAFVAWGQLDLAKAESQARLIADKSESQAQLIADKSESQARLLADEARLMADLAKRWDEPLLFDSRIEAAGKSPEDLLTTVENSYNAADKTFYTLIRVPNFFEDIGLMTREGTISESVVRKLFEGPVIGTWNLWKPAIDYLRTATGRERMYEHFQWLNGRM